MSDSEDQKLLIQKEKEQKKTSDRVHFFLSGVLVVMSYVFWSDFTSFRQKAPALGIEMRQLSDGIYIVLVAIGLQVLRRILDRCLRSRLEKHLMKENLLDLE